MLTRNASRIKPAPVKATITLFDAGARRGPSAFGRGVLPRYAAQYTTVPYSVSDAEWAAAEFCAQSTYEPLWSDQAIDRRAGEAAAQDRLDRGLIAHELAEEISRGSLVGHWTDHLNREDGPT